MTRIKCGKCGNEVFHVNRDTNHDEVFLYCSKYCGYEKTYISLRNLHQSNRQLEDLRKEKLEIESHIRLLEGLLDARQESMKADKAKRINHLSKRMDMYESPRKS